MENKVDMVKGLYMGRYLIAIYGKNDELIDVGVSPKELHCFKSVDSAKSVISKAFRNERFCPNIHFIDVLEKHDDTFSDEDDDFLQCIEKEFPSTKKVCSKNNISERTYYRKKRKFSELNEKSV